MDSTGCSCSLNILSSQPRWEGLCFYFTLPSLAARRFMPVDPFQIWHESTCGPRQVENGWPCSSGCGHSCNPESRNTFAGPGSCLPCLCEIGCVCSCLGQKNSLVCEAALRRALLGCLLSPFKILDDGS